MKDQDYIRAAVELASNFQIIHDATIYCLVDHTWHVHLSDCPTVMLDALAAQLVRQMYSHCIRPIELAGPIHYDLYDPMNTLKAIVDSKVLK